MRHVHATAALVVVAAAAAVLAGCAGASVTNAPNPSLAGTGAPGVAMTVTRTGGIAGFNDVVTIALDGSATVTTKNGETRACTPDAAALAHLRAIDLAAIGSKPSSMADGFNYSVTVGGGTASAGEGETTAIRAAFVSAAGTIVNSCIASATSSGAPEQ